MYLKLPWDSVRKHWSECISANQNRLAEHLSQLIGLARQIYVHIWEIFIPLH